MPPFEVDDQVRLIDNPERSGRVVRIIDEGEGEFWVMVEFPGGRPKGHPDYELEIVDENESPQDLFLNGRFGGASALRRHLVLQKLSGRLADVIYSLNTTVTDYYPHKFKPVIRFLESPSKGILIADEVGLGTDKSIDFISVAFEFLLNPLALFSRDHGRVFSRAHKCVSLIDEL